MIYLWQRTAGPSSFFSLTACASIWTGRSAIAGNIWMHWNTRKDRSRTHKMVVLYCVCVCWIQCFDLPCVTATFWLRIGLTGSFLNQGWDPEGPLQDPPVTSHVVPWGQQWMKSLQHTAYWKKLNVHLLLNPKHNSASWLFVFSGRFTCGRGQQAHPPSLVLQHVLPSGQAAVLLQGTSECTETQEKTVQEHIKW